MRTGGIKDWGAELTASAHELAEYLGDTSNGSALRIVGMELEEAVQEFGNVWIYNSLRFLEGYDLEQGLDLSIIEKELLSNVENEPIEAERKVKDLGEFLSKLKRGSSLAVDYAIAQAMQEEELAYEALPLPKKERHMEKVVNPQLGNAFNRYDDLGYWYQDSDITAVAKLLLKDFENTEFVGAIGRCKYQSVDAKEILKRKEKELEAEKKLTGIYNTGGNHWIAFIIFKDAAGKITCVYKDSRGKERIDFEQDIKTVFIGVKINRLQKGQAEQKLEYDNIISGGNGLVSCGIFALKNLVILARCESIDDCWNAGYYSPGDTEIQYRDTLKCNREEYGLLYAKSIYEGLQDNDSRLKDFIDQLKLEDREKLDESLISELAKQVDVSVEEIKKIIQGEGKVSYIKIAGNPSETVEDSKSIVDNKTTSVTKK
ncbi:MAG: hypothetical protein K0R73_1319, partial [Candidatus Midichloriaceae bacterium]|nr:hypothetical protein [Candidatus Midichloriaceae bacterium]